MKIPFPFDGEVGAGLKPALTVWVIFILRCARAGHGGLSEIPSESLVLWKLLQNKRAKQVKKITEIAKIILM